VTVQLNVDMRDDFGAALRALSQRTRRLDDALESIGGSLLASTQQRFLDEESPTGQGWKEHSEATELKRGSGADILRDHNHLFDSLDDKVDGSQVAVGTNMVYARIQHLGGQAGRGKKVTIPARPYLGVSEADRTEIRDVIQEFLEGAL
jgi:phage virion morphogenesis protein